MTLTFHTNLGRRIGWGLRFGTMPGDVKKD